MDPYQRARLYAPSANPQGLNSVEFAALQRCFATRPEAAAARRDQQPVPDGTGNDAELVADPDLSGPKGTEPVVQPRSAKPKPWEEDEPE